MGSFIPQGRAFKRSLLYAALLIAGPCMIISSYTLPAYAHVLQSNNGVSAVLHIEPADDPIAGVNTTVGLEFNSTDPNFNLKDYTVTADIRGVSVTASKPPVTVTSDTGETLYGTAQILFPEPGSYTLDVKGVSNKGNETADFKLTFEIRAEQPQIDGSNTASASGGSGGGGFDSLLIGIAALGLLGVLARYQIRQGGRYNKR